MFAVQSIILGERRKEMRWSGHVARMVLKRNAYTIFVGKFERKIRLGRPRPRRKELIKMNENVD